MATPSHVDLSVLWVPIMPETSKMGPALEQAGKDAKGKFGQAVKGIADPVQQELAQAGSKTGPAMQLAGKEAKSGFAQGVKGIGDHIHEDLAKAGAKAKDSFANVGNHISDTLKRSASNAGRAMSDTFHSATNNLENSLNRATNRMEQVGGVAKNVGIDIGTWISPLDGVSQKTGEAKAKISEFAETIKGMPGHIGKVGEAIAGLAGPLGAVIGTLHQIDNDPALKDLKHLLQGTDNPPPAVGPGQGKVHIPGLGDIGITPGSLADSLLQGTGAYTPPPGPPVHVDPNGPWRNLILPGAPTPGQPALQIPGLAQTVPGAAAPPRDYWRTAPSSTTGGSSGATGGSGSSYTASGAGSATSGTDWDAIAQGESSGNWSINTGNGYFGGLQIAQSTWDEFGGKEFAERPDLASREDQITVAERILRKQGRRAWPNTYQLGAPGGSGGSGGGSRGGGGSSPSSGLSGRGISGGGDFGTSAGHPTVGPPDENMIRSWVQSNFGIPNTFGTGSWENAAHDADGGWHHNLTHDKSVPGYAFDFHGTPEQMSTLANWVANNYAQNTLELIYGGKGFDQSREIKNGRFGDVYGAALNAAHTDHVHWAMSRAPYEAGGSGKGSRPLGSQHDPIYVTTADGSGGGSPFEQQGQQLGQGLVNGILEMFGIDGSVLKGFGSGRSPLDFGIMKLGGGLLNWMGGLGAAQAGAGGAAGGDGAMLPGLGNLIPGLGGLIPNAGAAISASAIPQKAAAAAGGGTTINNTYHGPVGGFTVNGVGTVQEQKEVSNSSNRTQALAVNLPAAGG